jgi:tetratricopeptide (TPR) repeat protein
VTIKSDGMILEARRRCQNGDLAGAERLCRQVLEGAPGHAGALYVLGLVARTAGNNAGAIACLREASNSRGAPFFVFDALSQLCLEQGLLDEAADASARAVTIDAGQEHAWRRLAIVQTQRAQFEEARIALEHLVALNPRSVSALNHLGTMLQQLGQADLAAQRYREALAIDAGYAEAHSNLAAALAVLGAYDEALTHARRAIDLKPNYVSPYVHAALAEADRGRCEAALQWIDRIPATEAPNPAVLVAHADIFGRFGRFEEGINACRKAIARQPDFGDAHNALGILLDALARDQEALDAFDRAAALSPRPGVPLARKGAVLMQLGREPEALALFDQARAHEPSSALILYMQAAAKDFKLEDADLEAIEQLLLENRTPSHTDRMYLHFALGGAYLGTGNTARAFPQLEAGNCIKRSLVAYDPAADERRMAATISAFPVERVAEARKVRADSNVPIFVIGMPRSGTTLVEQILSSHPLIQGAGELRDFDQVVGRAESAHGQAFPHFVSRLGAEEYGELGREYLARIGPPAPGALHIVDKMPLNSLYAGMIHLALPGARIIHCRRDPLDTCFSCYSKLFMFGQEFSYDLTELGRYYRAHELLMAHWRAVLPAETFLEIDYESIVDDIESAARRLIAFCGVDWSPTCLRFHETVRTIRTASAAQVRRPLYRNSIGRWREFRAELAPLIAALDAPGRQ